MNKTVILQIEVQCHESLKESEIEKALNLAINNVVRNQPSADFGTISGQNVRMGYIQWTDAHVDRRK